MDKIQNHNITTQDLLVNKTFTDIFDIEGGTQPPKSNFIYKPKDGYIRLLQIRDFGNSPVPTYIPADKKLKLCRKNDILIGRYGASVGRICTGMEGAYNVALTKVVPLQKMDTRFIYHLLSSNQFQKQLIKIERSAQNGFNKDDLSNIYLPFIADYDKQTLIAKKLDALLGTVGGTKGKLVKANRLINRFRKAILIAAITGKLTEEWRGGKELEQANLILENLKKQRLQGNISLINKQKIENIYSFKEESDTSDLPDGWKYTALDKICSSFQYGTSTKSDKEGDIPVLRMGNLQNGEIDWSNLAYTSDPEEIEKYKLRTNEVLFNRTNSPELVGKTSIYRGEREAIFAGYLIKINHYPVLNPEYLNYCLNSQLARNYCYQVKTDGVSQSNINAQKLGKFEVPFCSILEQEEIVKRIKTYFNFANEVEKRIKKAETRVSKLTQAVLAKTFSEN